MPSWAIIARDFWLSDRYSAQQNRAARHQTCLAHLARDIAWVGQVGDETIGLRLKLWIDAVFSLARSLGDLAASTVKRKRRDLDTRIADIVCTATECEQTPKVLRKFANARDQLTGLFPCLIPCPRRLAHSLFFRNKRSSGLCSARYKAHIVEMRRQPS